jgi:hypothetical protein
VEPPSLDDTLETLALGPAGNIDVVPDLEYVRATNLLARFIFFESLAPELDKVIKTRGCSGSQNRHQP